MNTIVNAPHADTVAAVGGLNDRTYMDWGAIIAGAAVAMAISAIFLAFGSAIGLSLVGMSSSGTSMTAGLVAASLWLMWVQLSGLMGGSYVAGRMRRPIGDAKPHERTVRDGTHGLVVWAVSVVAGGVLAAMISAAGLTALSNLGGAAVSAAANAMPSTEYTVDRLLRPAPNAAVPAEQTGATPAAPPSQEPASQPVQSAQSQELGRILTSTSDFSVDDDEKAYMARMVAARTGLTEAEARARVDETLNTLAAQAEQARRMGIFAAFLAAATLLVGAVASWWAATTGGNHRDESVDHSRYAMWR